MESSDIVESVPDGGWGWVVVAAVAFINMTNQSILSVFGLLFGAQLKAMNHGTFTAALITNLNSLALNFSGLFIGPIIRTLKPRNVASFGCILVSLGMFLCNFATKGWHFTIGYSFCVGVGLGLISPSTFIAINSYFTTKRGRAVGIALAGAGLGQIIIPHLVRLLLELYGFRSTVIVMSLFSFTGTFGALLLKPFKPTPHKIQHHNKPLLDADINKEFDKMELRFDNAIYHDSVRTHQTLCNRFCERFVESMDLELLRDPVFWNIIIGMALVYTATVNFTMLYPNFLQYSVGFTSSNTANCMSIMAGADIICRLLLPCITDKYKIPYRSIFLMGTIGLLVSRAALAETANMSNIIVLSIFTGITKSATVLNNNLTISSYCCSENLPGGLGLHMISKGILVITIGQLLGWIRDHNKSYILCMHAQNILLLLVIVSWVPEMCYHFHRQRSERTKVLRRTTKNAKNIIESDNMMKTCSSI